mgnify:CR=1 FL=1
MDVQTLARPEAKDGQGGSITLDDFENTSASHAQMRQLRERGRCRRCRRSDRTGGL